MGNFVQSIKDTEKTGDLFQDTKAVQDKYFGKQDERNISEEVQNEYEKKSEFVDTYLNGKDCTGCKVVAVVNPLILASYMVYSYRKQDKSLMRPQTRLLIAGSYGSLIFLFLNMSILSLVGAWTIPRPDEPITDYIERDSKTFVNKFRSLYSKGG